MVIMKRLSGFVLAHHLRRTIVVNPEGYSPYTSSLMEGYQCFLEHSLKEAVAVRQIYDLRHRQLAVRYEEYDLLKERLEDDPPAEEQIDIYRRIIELRDEVMVLTYG